jgi:hypothetical protein
MLQDNDKLYQKAINLVFTGLDLLDKAAKNIIAVQYFS